MLRENTLKAKLRAGTPCFGAMINFPSPHVAELCGLAGLDFVVVDAEHGPMDPIHAEEMVRAAMLSGATPIVRVPQNSPQTLLRYLDVGSLGVQVPMINSRQEAESMVASVKYHPEGRRGLAGTRAASYGLDAPLSDYVIEANAQTLIVAQIETIQAVEALPQILEVPGIDVVFIGPTDLSQSMGFPGRQGEPSVQQAIDRCFAQILEAGRPAGTIARDGEHAKQLIDRGITYLAGVAVGLLGSSIRAFTRIGRGG